LEIFRKFLGDKIIYFNIFLNKKILKNNNYYIFKHLEDKDSCGGGHLAEAKQGT
jgi:hypothetical protein